MAEDKKARDAIEHAGQQEKPASTGTSSSGTPSAGARSSNPSASSPAAGPHAKPHLTDKDKTPGSGAFAEEHGGEVDAGPE